MAVVNPTAAGESNEVDLSDKLATREVASMKNTSHLEEWPIDPESVPSDQRGATSSGLMSVVPA